MPCPNSTEGGCRCPEHHPGLGLGIANPTGAATLHVVTAGPTTAQQQRDILDSMLAEARASCTACQGDPERCRQGTGEPQYRRLPHCAAWDSNGQPQALQAPAQPRQPWQPRPARHAA